MSEMNGKIERSFFTGLKNFFHPLWKNKFITFRALIPSVSLSISGVILVYLLKEITNNFSAGNFEQIKTYVWIFMGVGMYSLFILLIGRNWVHSYLWPSYRKYMYERFILEYVSLDNNEVEKIGTGKFIAIIDKGMHAWVDILVHFVDENIAQIFVIFFSFVLIFFINTEYFYITFSIFLSIFFLTFFLQKRAKYLRLKRRDTNIIILSRFVKVLMSKFEIFQNNKAQEETQKVTNLLQENVRLNNIIENYNVVTDFLIRFIIDGAKVILLLTLVFGFFGQKINIGEFVSLLSILYMLDTILNRSLQSYIDFTIKFPDVEKLWDTFESIPRIQDSSSLDTFIYKTGDISLQNLNYSYEGNKNVFENFDLKIIGGKVTAFVGPSGGGKSTLVKLIAGYLKAERGDILIDGQKLSETSLKSYYQDVGYLTQEPSVFDGTVRENLMYAIGETHSIATPSVLRTSPSMRETSQEIPLMEGEKTMEKKKGELQPGEESHGGELQLSEQNFEKKLQEIISLAHCEFIFDLPNGLDTEIGERGVKLSGGQKQRLAIAKIFLKNPKIIILDEPTSALDSLSEKKITEAMHNLFQNRTVLVIAHRLQTVKYADDIIVIEQGKIVERGNHESLVEKKGYYAEMLELQSGF